MHPAKSDRLRRMKHLALVVLLTFSSQLIVEPYAHAERDRPRNEVHANDLKRLDRFIHHTQNLSSPLDLADKVPDKSRPTARNIIYAMDERNLEVPQEAGWLDCLGNYVGGVCTKAAVGGIKWLFKNKLEGVSADLFAYAIVRGVESKVVEAFEELQGILSQLKTAAQLVVPRFGSFVDLYREGREVFFGNDIFGHYRLFELQPRNEFEPLRVEIAGEVLSVTEFNADLKAGGQRMELALSRLWPLAKTIATNEVAMIDTWMNALGFRPAFASGMLIMGGLMMLVMAILIAFAGSLANTQFDKTATYERQIPRAQAEAEVTQRLIGLLELYDRHETTIDKLGNADEEQEQEAASVIELSDEVTTKLEQYIVEPYPEGLSPDDEWREEVARPVRIQAFESLERWVLQYGGVIPGLEFDYTEFIVEGCLPDSEIPREAAVLSLEKLDHPGTDPQALELIRATLEEQALDLIRTTHEQLE